MAEYGLQHPGRPQDHAFLTDGMAAVRVDVEGHACAGRLQTAQRLAENPHFIFADAQAKGYGVVEFTPSQLTTTLRVVDDVTRQDTRVETLATFTVQSGRPMIERV